MNLTDTFSGTEPPLQALGVENSTYHQVLVDGRITVWVKKSGVWNASSDVGSGSLAGNRINHYYSSVRLTDAQIKALPTTQVEVIAAQGSNTIIIPLFCWLHMIWVDDYDNIGDTATIGLGYGNSKSSTLMTLNEAVSSNVSNLLVDGASHGAMLAPFIAINGPDSAVSSLGQFLDDPGPVNAAMKIWGSNTGSHTGDFTEGNAGNSLLVAVPYVVFNKSTGAFL